MTLFYYYGTTATLEAAGTHVPAELTALPSSLIWLSSWRVVLRPWRAYALPVPEVVAPHPSDAAGPEAPLFAAGGAPAARVPRRPCGCPHALVAKVWLNNLLVTVTVLNCWSTPLVRFFFRHADPRNAQSAALERFLVLAVDFVLDATTSMVIPMLLFAPYFAKFDFEVFNFETEFLYDDIWFANMVMENQQLLAQTKWDFFSKMVPHLSIYGSLNSMRALVKPPPRLASSAARVYCESPAVVLPTPPTAANTATAATATAIPTTTEKGDSTPVELLEPADPQLEELSPRDGQVTAAAAISISTPKPKPKPPSRITSNSFPPIREGKPLTHPSMGVIQRNLSFLLSPSSSSSSSTSAPLPPYAQRPRQRLLQNAMQLVLFLWGLALLVLHMRAAWRAQSVALAACTTRTRPWFATNVSCAVVRFNCFAHNVTTPTNALLEMIEPSSVGALVFSHCAQLHMPSILSQFRNLLGVDMYNCTLHTWGLDAAITAQRHPRLTYLIFVYTNMTRLPDGVLQPLPATMTDFEIAVSNLTHLPDDLHERWHPMSLLYVEHAQLTVFPPTLLHLHVDDLSLIGNQIESLPEFDSTTAFFTLAMTRTPLRELPASIGDPSTIGFLNLGYTQLTVLPPWMDLVATTATKICIHNTPFCQRQSDENIYRHYGVDAVVSCMAESDENVDGKYPLAILRPKRPLLPELPPAVDAMDSPSDF